MNEYGAAKGGDNTGLTEEQIQTIVSRTLAGSMTSAQVEAIVKKYNSGSTLTASQVKQIVDAAMANSLSAAEVRAVVDAALTTTNANINTIVSDVAEIKTNALTEEQIEAIVKKYAGAGNVTVEAGGNLSEAIASAEEGSVIALAGDVSLTESLTIDKNVTLDIGANNISLADGKQISVGSGATLTIKGDSGSIEGTATIISVSGNLVIEGGNFVGGTSSYCMMGSSGTGTIVINDGTFSTNDGAYYAVGTWGNSTIIINGGTFNCPISVSANATLENGEPVNKYAQCIINGGSFTGTLEGEPVIFWPVGTLSVYGGTFTASDTVFAICGGNVKLYGGTITTTGDVEAAIYSSGTFNDSTSAVTVIAQRGSAYQLTGLTISENVVINVPSDKQAVAVWSGDSTTGASFGEEIDLSTTTTVTVNGTPSTITLNIADKFK